MVVQAVSAAVVFGMRSRILCPFHPLNLYFLREMLVSPGPVTNFDSITCYLITNGRSVCADDTGKEEI